MPFRKLYACAYAFPLAEHFYRYFCDRNLDPNDDPNLPGNSHFYCSSTYSYQNPHAESYPV